MQDANRYQQAFSSDKIPTLHRVIPALHSICNRWEKKASDHKYLIFHDANGLEEKIDPGNYRTMLEQMFSQMRLLTVILSIKLFMFLRRKPRLVSRIFQALTIVLGFQGRCPQFALDVIDPFGPARFASQIPRSISPAKSTPADDLLMNRAAAAAQEHRGVGSPPKARETYEWPDDVF